MPACKQHDLCMKSFMRLKDIAADECMSHH